MLRPLDRTLSSPAVPAGAKVLTIGELTRAVKGVLEQDFASFWATGEVSNLKRHSSGHIYMTLKDAESQIRAVMWRSQAIRLRFDLREGMEVVVRGRLTVYVPRGEYQIQVGRILVHRYLPLRRLVVRLVSSPLNTTWPLYTEPP